ncbi:MULTISPECIES: hypothetical protein [unclassified Pseudomonas]|uniref:hypothetical protein n=1 Tax=unclassified Pseudomonas TaxID=196821 RepID=UPI0025DA2B21|nr:MULTISPECIES: hypothetical protein [unclassified Pseudomonas]
MKHAFPLLPIAVVAIHSFAYGQSMVQPDVSINQHPTMRYEVTVKLDGAPGSFDRIEGMADYRVKNEDCVALTPVTGATVPPERRVPLKLVRSEHNLYTFEFFADLLQDKNYFDKGVCHWVIVAVSANLWNKSVDFSAPLFHDDLFRGRSVTRYYSNRSYATTQLDRVDVGEANRAQYQDEADATFSITLNARHTPQ